MSVSTLKRISLAVALLLAAPALFAANPSARTGARMVYDESTGNVVLFGGVAPVDAGTLTAYQPQETWLWNGRWIQRYPAHSPSGRQLHFMVYDSKRSRVVLFGGRNGTTDLADTWVYANNDWSEITTSNAPSPRALGGAAYDRDRDRVVLFGGNHTVPPAMPTGTPTVTNYYDTWEFDGNDWLKASDSGPQVIRPILVYDEGRHQTLMIGEDAALKPVMYSYDSNARVWNPVTAAAMPPCVNDAAVVYQRSTGNVLLVGGACVTSTFSSSTIDDVWSWDGSTWTKIATKTTIVRVTDQALAYDPQRNVVIEFGGTEAYGAPRSATYVFDPSVTDTTNTPPAYLADWIFRDGNDTRPGPRSLAPLEADPTNKVLYLLNGLTDSGTFSDFWMYQNGGWSRITAADTPSCGTPFAAFDTDRSRLVAVCNDGSTYEWDGSAWKTFADLKTKPGFRRFSSMAYDATLKKTVLYGGYDDTNYVNNTWLWDGTAWTEQKDNRAPSRALAAMWFDPNLKQTVIYGGIGRPNPQDRLQRYNDMWALGANGWTQLKPATVPGTRYGAQVAVNPTNNKVFLFGGLRLDVDAKGLQKQVYADDEWEWDGANWKQITTNNTPPGRENGAMAWDYSRQEFVLFGGWAGYFLSDTWLRDGDTWTLIPERTGRQRAIR